MAYTHYWRVAPELDPAAFARIAADFEDMAAPIEHLGVDLAGGDGQGGPVIRGGQGGQVLFNGRSRRRVHPHEPPRPGTAAGCILESDCDGDLSYETFALAQKTDVSDPRRLDNGRIFRFCKTARRPYDIAVKVCLIIADRHLGDAISIGSDGGMDDWQDAMLLCQHFLGYGAGFVLEELK